MVMDITRNMIMPQKLSRMISVNLLILAWLTAMHVTTASALYDVPVSIDSTNDSSSICIHRGIGMEPALPCDATVFSYAVCLWENLTATNLGVVTTPEGYWPGIVYSNHLTICTNDGSMVTGTNSIALEFFTYNGRPDGSGTPFGHGDALKHFWVPGIISLKGPTTMKPGEAEKFLAQSVDGFVVWNISKVVSDDEWGNPIRCSIDLGPEDINTNATLTVDKKSGSGIIVLRATRKETECWMERTIRVGCDCGCSGAGKLDCYLNSMDARFSLGKASQGGSYGNIYLRATDQVDPEQLDSLSTRAGLGFEFFDVAINHAQVDEELKLDHTQKIGLRYFVYDNGPRQLMTPDCLVVFNDEPEADGFTIDYYNPSNVMQFTNGMYELMEGAPPFESYKISSSYSLEDGQINNIELNINRTNDNTVNTYIWSDGKWTLSRDNGDTESIEIQSGNKVIRRVVGADGQCTEEITRWFGWGRDIIGIAEGSGSDLRTTEYAYYGVSNTPYCSMLKQITYPNGMITSNQYDSNKRVTQITQHWLDIVGGRATIYGYSSVAPSVDTLTAKGDEPRTIIQTIQGITNSVIFNVYYVSNNTLVEISEQAYVPTAGYENPLNQRTVTIRDSASDNILSQTYPDGRMEVYAYSNGTYHVVTANPAANSFTPDAGSDKITWLTHLTVSSPGGTSWKTTKECTVTDSQGRTRMRKTFVYTGNNYLPIDWTVYEANSIGHVIREIYADGTQVSNLWDCCNIGSSIGRFGELTDYAYAGDQLLEVITVGVDAGDLPQANRKTRYEYDTRGRQTRATQSAIGCLQTLSSSIAYDCHGRVITQTDAAGLVTSNAYDSNDRDQTCIMPGGATQITINYIDGQTRSVTGTGVTPQFYEYGINEDGSRWTKVSFGSAGTASPRWSKTTTDSMGRTILEERSGFSGSVVSNRYFYNSNGQLTNQTSSGMADTLIEYNDFGEQTRSGLDLDHDGALENDHDRVFVSENYYAQDSSGDVWRVSASTSYSGPNGTAVTNSLIKQRLTGLSLNLNRETRSTDAYGKTIVQITSVVPYAKRVVEKTFVPESTNFAEVITINGLVYSQKSTTGHRVTFGYDGLGRQTSMTDPRLGTSQTHYNDLGQIAWIVDPAGNRVSNTYYAATGLKSAETDPLTNRVYSSYDLRGNLVRTWGSSTYPVSYVYDEFGQMTNMTTYRAGTNWDQPSWPNPGSGDVTRWLYDPSSGLMTNKIYADNGRGTAYTYTPEGKLSTRAWARETSNDQLRTTYTYTDSGELSLIDYSPNSFTPDLSFVVDRYGRTIQLVDQDMPGAGHQFIYDIAGKLLAESWGDAQGVIHNITNAYDSYGRNSGFNLDGNYAIQYGNDPVGRMGSLTCTINGTNRVFTYSYLTNSDLLAGLTESRSGFTITRKYENNRDLITQVKNSMGTNLISQFDYQNDCVGRRLNVRQSGRAFQPGFNKYGYNPRGEVISAEKFWGTNLSVQTQSALGQKWNYEFDNIGNRKSASRSMQQSDYTANNLNQYTERSVPGYAEILGIAKTQAMVSVNSSLPQRQGEYFRSELLVTNDGNAVYQPVAVLAVYAETNAESYALMTGHIFVAKTPETFGYDADGNLTNDSRFSYGWDCENRLISVETRADLSASVPRYHLYYAYDYMNRMVHQVAQRWDGSNWQSVEERDFVYQGWNLVAEIIRARMNNSESFNITTNYYVWGLDLSGSLQGAGGISGLLSADFGGTNGTSTVFYAYDANGNVSELVDGDSGAIAAHYEYSPFGETVVQAGDEQVLAQNPYAFSTKYFDRETSLYYYGLRFYNPGTGRWLSRDSVAEQGGLNIYGFVDNEPVSQFDLLGMFDLPPWLGRIRNRQRTGMSYATFEAALGIMVAEIDAARGDDPWFPRFMENYLFGTGRGITLTPSEVRSLIPRSDDLFAGFDFHANPGFFCKSGNRGNILQPRLHNQIFHINHSKGIGNQTLNQFYVDYFGKVKGNCDFEGWFRINDDFNYNWIWPWGGPGRSIPGETLLRAFTLLVHGLSFHVDSEWMPISQKDSEDLARWK